MITQWKDASICSIYNQSDKLHCKNYRGITLLNTSYKIFSNILAERLATYASRVIREYQCEIWKGRSTTDQIHNIKQILEKNREYDIDTVHLFIEFRSACDIINREKLPQAMLEFGIPNILFNLIRRTLIRAKCRAKLGSELSQAFYTEKGLTQGEALSHHQSNIALEKVIRDSGIQTQQTIFIKCVQMLTFEDDIDIVGRSKAATVEAFSALEAAA